MARILIKDEWYDQLAPNALYEGEFETIVLQNATSLFPDFFAVPFKALVESEYGTAKPDLALIDRNFREWWVVEVELSHHSLSGHVLPQVQVFATGEYSHHHARYLADRNTEMDRGRLLSMLKGQPPSVLVVVNAPCPEWTPVLRRFRALVTIFEIFRSAHDRQVFRLNGEQPMPSADVISVCEFDRFLPKFLRVLSPAALPCVEGEIARIQYKNMATHWKRLDAQDAVWLVPVGPNPLTPGSSFQIVLDESGELSIYPITKRG